MTLEQENALLALITDPLEKINRRAIEEVARQLKKIGTLSAKNIDQLNMQHEAGIAASEIMAAVARVADTTVKHVYDVLENVAKSEYAASDPLFAFRGIDRVPYEQNGKMRRNVRAIARRTCETMSNISLTRGQNVGLKTSAGFMPLNKAYKQIVDEGIQSAIFGGKSYDEATRETIKTFGGSGLRVQYDSGNTRRVDSAARMNTLDGIRAVNAEVQREISDTIRADKVEISVHLPPLYCAPDHLEYQGLVMTREELDKLNSTTLAYPKRAIAVGALNCRHYTLAFLDGISKPRHTPEQLAEIVKSAKEIHEITYTDRFGREQRWTGTLYEATQVQRQMETALRYTKEGHNAAKVAENKTLESELRREITGRNKEYESFSGAIGLKAQTARARVEPRKKQAEIENTPNQKRNGFGAGSETTGRGEVPKQIGKIGRVDKEAIVQAFEELRPDAERLPYEVSYTVTKDGAVWYTRGDKAGVHPERIETELGHSLSGSYSYHNHPKDSTYFSLSEDDVGFFFGHHQRYSMASDFKFKYFMERTVDTPTLTYEGAHDAFIEIFKTEVRRLAYDGLIDIDIDGYHETMERLAKKLRFTYRRESADGK